MDRRIRGSNQNDVMPMRKWTKPASQPHFVSPMVTTHVMLVQQYRFTCSWQQIPAEHVTSNYGASHGWKLSDVDISNWASSSRPIWYINRAFRMDVRFFSDKSTGRFQRQKAGLLSSDFPWRLVPHG